MLIKDLKPCTLVLLFLAGFALIGSASACGTPVYAAADSSGLAATPIWAVEVDPIFRETYDFLGGAEVLGYAIQPAEQTENIWRQYTSNALLQYNPAAPAGQQFSLAALGQQFRPQDAPLNALNPQGAQPGYVIYHRFETMLAQLQGERFTGKPISQPLYVAESGYIIQLFENLGFAISAQNTSSQVMLLPYGVAACGERCAATPLDTRQLFNLPAHSEPFINTLEAFRALTGLPISPYYRTSDGEIEQVYENVVAYAPSNNLYHVRFRQTPQMVGINPQAPVERRLDDAFIFFPLENSNLGFNVPQVFDAFITQHGGTAYSGMPISETFWLVEGESMRQCFQTYCLDYQFADAMQPVHAATLGNNFMQAGLHQRSGTQSLAAPAASILLSIWKDASGTGMQTQDVIHANLYQITESIALSGVPVTLTVSLPDGTELGFIMPATDETGNTSITLPQLLLENGTLISYKVCADVFNQSVCQGNAFTLWRND